MNSAFLSGHFQVNPSTQVENVEPALELRGNGREIRSMITAMLMPLMKVCFVVQIYSLTREIHSKSDASLMGESTCILLKRFAMATSKADAIALLLLRGFCLAGVPPGDLGRGVLRSFLALPEISLRKFGRVGVLIGFFVIFFVA